MTWCVCVPWSWPGWPSRPPHRAADTPQGQEKKPPQQERKATYSSRRWSWPTTSQARHPEGRHRANTPLRDALEFVAATDDLPILINNEAFKTEGIQEVEAPPVRLERMANVKLQRVCRCCRSSGRFRLHPQ